MAKSNKAKSLGPEFECGMLAGFTDGISLMHQILTDAVGFTAPTHPGVSAFLKAFADGVGKDLPNMLRRYHEAKELSVPLEVVATKEDRKWN